MGYDSLRNDTKIGGFYFRWIWPFKKCDEKQPQQVALILAK